MTSAVVGAEDAGRGDRDVHAVGVARVEQDRVQAHAAGAGCHCGPEPCSRRPWSSCQVAAPSVDLNSAASCDPGVHRVGVGRRRLEVPDPGELPRLQRAVVPLVHARGRPRSWKSLPAG